MDLRAPATNPDFVVIADRGSGAGSSQGPEDTERWVQPMAHALLALGYQVVRVAPERAGQVAFESGAAALVLNPQAPDTPADLWLSVVERAGRQLPTTLVVTASADPQEAVRWLAAGFDDHACALEPADAIVARLAARVRSQAIRNSLAVSDPLTGLPSPNVFFSRLDPMLRLSSRTAMPMSVAVLDMDGFVAMEAQRGRGVVRALLMDIATHLRGALRRSDTVARLGDDRFGLILHHINGLEARKLLYKIWRSLVLEPATLDLLGSQTSLPTFTCGIAVFPDDATDGFELYTRAEMALDVARATGHRRISLFSETSGDSGGGVGGTDLRLHRSERGTRSDPE